MIKLSMLVVMMSVCLARAQDQYESFVSPAMATNPAYVAFMKAYDVSTNRLLMLNDMIQGNGDPEAVFLLKMFKAEYYRDNGDLQQALSIFDEVVTTDTNSLHGYYAIRQKGVYYTLDGNVTGTVQCAMSALQLSPSENETWRILYAIKYNNDVSQYDRLVSDYSCQKMVGTTNVLMAERFHGLITTNYYPASYLKGAYSTVLSNLVGDSTSPFYVRLQQEVAGME